MLLHWGGIRFWWFRWGPCSFSTIHLGTGALTVQLQRCFAWGVACKPTNLFLPKFSTGAKWNAEFQAVKRCSGLEVLKVYLEALGERQKNVGSFVSGAWLCDHPQFGLFRPVVGQEAEESFVACVSFNFWVQLTPNNRIYICNSKKVNFFHWSRSCNIFPFQL